MIVRPVAKPIFSDIAKPITATGTGGASVPANAVTDTAVTVTDGGVTVTSS